MKRNLLSGLLLLCAVLFFSTELFAVCDNVTVSGTVGSNQTVCGAYNPLNITNVTYPTGGTGTLQYQWQSSPNGTTWTDIAGATLESYDPPTISSTTYYHRLERRSTCTVYAGTSNTITKTVNPAPTASITAGGATTFCGPGSVTLTANAAAGTTYQWKKNGSNIVAATNQTYVANATGNYTVVKTVTATGCVATSNTITVTVQTSLTTTITEPGFNPCGASTVLMQVQSGTGYTYQWYEDGNLLPNAIDYQYSTGHNGNYSCTTTNLCGSYPSSTYVLNNPALSVYSYGFINATSSTTICTGQAVTLMEQLGYLAYSGYQWYKDGVMIAGANNYWYNATQAGHYSLKLNDYCWQTATYYDFYTNWITITNSGGTIPTPSITAGGATTICQGASVLLTEAIGAGWTYQWQKNNLNISGATNTTYSANATGSYTCVASNSCGSYPSNAIAVTVQPITATISISGATTICGGSSAPLTSTSAGASGTYQWKLNTSNISGATQSTYAATASGSYTCAITNSCGTFTSNAIVITVSGTCSTGLLFDGGTDYVQMPNNAAYSFGTGNFTVEAWIKLNPAQTYTPVLLSNRPLGTSSGFIVSFITGRLALTMAGTSYYSGNDLRDNTCHHIAVSRYSASSLVLYVDGVAVGTYTSNVGANVTTSAVLLMGNDAHIVSYYRGSMMDVRLWNTSRTLAQIQANMNTALTGSESGLVGYWKLNDGSGQVANDYSPTNNDGRLGSTTGTDIYDPSFAATCSIAPSVNCNLPTNLTATSITNTSVQLNWANATADSFMVRYAVHNTTNFVWKKISGQPNVVSTSLTGLLPATQYDWWVRSLCNSIASSNYQSSPATFTTLSIAVPCITPYGLGATNIGNTSATISWTNLVSADTFRIRYSVNGTANFIWKDVNGAGGSSTSLTGLSPNTAYQFQVSSKCVGVTSAYSASYIFTTLNIPVPCITPYNLGATNIGNTSVTISWTNLVSADTFRVRYSVNGTANFIWKDVNGAGGNSTSLTGLSPNTAYQFQVSSKCAGVTSAYSSSYVFNTLNTPVPCIIPYGLSTTNITANSAKVNWTYLVSADTFRVRYSINGTANFMWKDVNGAGGVTNTTLTGLAGSSAYQWQISTICLGQSSGYSSSVVFSTVAPRSTSMEAEANLFHDVIVYPNPTHANATVQFSADEDADGNIRIYDITGREIQSSSFHISAGSNATEISTEKFPQGIYFIEMRSNGNSFARMRLVVE